MSDPFIGEVVLFAGNFAPRGWALCEGQILSINQNEALFSLLGTIYGGDGRTTFALPDLRGRVPVHPGQGPALSPVALGQKGGAETVALTGAQVPAHGHPVTEHPSLEVRVTADGANGPLPSATRRLGAMKLPSGQEYDLYTAAAPDTTLGGLSTTGALATGNAGGGQDHENMPPVLGIHYIIALTGTFPSRN